jgi:superoxide dismutase, Fe-Mn family
MGIFLEPFVRNAYLAATLAAVCAGVIGYFVVLRRLSFASHALAHVGFTGATAAVLIGADLILGTLLFTVATALGMGLLGNKLRGRDAAIGTTLAFAMGLGLLFLYLSTKLSSMATNILFGDILAVSDRTMRSLSDLIGQFRESICPRSSGAALSFLLEGEMHMTHLNRRDFLQATTITVGTLAVSPLAALAADQPVGFTLPPLPYAHDALEPAISKETMEYHHDKHHAAYVKNLNTALKDFPDLLKLPIMDLMREVQTKVPEKIRQGVINNGGGHLNHSLFWKMMAPKGKGGEPKGDLLKAIDARFGSLDKFQAAFSDAAVKRFGSGWAWLATKGEELEVFSLPNQDPTLLKGYEPLLGLDVWEHAYYIDYRNRRLDYIKNWWTVTNWDFVADRYNSVKKG